MYTWNRAPNFRVFSYSSCEKLVLAVWRHRINAEDILLPVNLPTTLIADHGDPTTPNSIRVGLWAHTVVDKESPAILGPWVFVFWTWLHLRKFWQCKNGTFRTTQWDLHEPIRVKLDIYIFWPSKIWQNPKQLAKNTEKCSQLLFQSQRWSHKNWTISTSSSATIKLAGFACPRLYIHILTLHSIFTP